MFDVVVAGAGPAGLMAALEAAEHGARVVVFEKLPRVGGKANVAIGTFTASETALQRASGIADTHAAHLDDMTRFAARSGIVLDRARALRRIEEDAETLTRLIALGLVFTGPHPEAPHAMPRMHNMKPGSGALVDVLAKRAMRAGVTVRVGTEIADVILDRRGAVMAVVARDAGHEVRLSACAVVLAAGDFIGNAEMIRRFSPRTVLAPAMLPHNSGAALAIAERLGARITAGDRPVAPQLRTVVPPHVEPAPALFALGARLEGEGDLYVVIDADVAARLAVAADDVGPGRDGWWRSGKPFVGTAPEIAYAYLDDCRRWSWYRERGSSVVLGPMRRFLMGTNATIATDDAMRVLRPDGTPIAGLFAAGDASLWFEYAGGHGYGLSWATTSGRLAGQAAAVLARTITTRAAP